MAITFEKATEFHRELKARVAGYFEETGARPRDLPQMYVKTAAIAVWLAASYYWLVFAAHGGWQVVLAVLSLALAAGAVGFDIQHDGSHGGYSNSRLVGRIMGFSLDIVGGSSYFWMWRHNVFHHTYPNINGADEDLNLGRLARFAPQQQRSWYHRFQQLYLWPLYGISTLKWHLMDDFAQLAFGKVGSRRVPRPRGKELALFVLGKLIFFPLAFGIPFLVRPWQAVVWGYVGISVVMGLVLAIVFMTAHCVEDADNPEPNPETLRMDAEWAVHQINTTVDFAQNNRLLTAYLGGLNFQVEHHLFPKVCHLHYPKIAPIVAEVCRKYGIAYKAEPTFRSAIAAHYRFLRLMGQPASDSKGHLPASVAAPANTIA